MAGFFVIQVSQKCQVLYPFFSQLVFSSFSQLGGNGDGDKKSKNQISQNILIIVAGVVLICALAFVVIYFATKPQIISPV